MGRLNGGERLVSEQRTDVWSERVTDPDREQDRHEGEGDAYCGPQSTLDAKSLVAVLNSPLLIHV
jgi:hypothetical protein